MREGKSLVAREGVEVEGPSQAPSPALSRGTCLGCRRWFCRLRAASSGELFV